MKVSTVKTTKTIPQVTTKKTLRDDDGNVIAVITAVQSPNGNSVNLSARNRALMDKYAEDIKSLYTDFSQEIAGETLEAETTKEETEETA